MTDVSEVFTASVMRALMMKAIGASVTSVNVYEITCRNIPEGCHLLYT
jgi:hypothetical protein